MNQKELLKSDIVRSLVDGKLHFDENQEPHSIYDFDNIYSKSILLPIATDVSQMEAVLTAQQGCSFILHGPPGTGKSQTITNIIADSLYRGKRVLFVAAKKAALDVVHRRLEQIGLAPFTLELHSNKSKKSHVLAQLASSIETAKIANTLDFEQEAERLDSTKKAISEYINVLHQKQQCGWSSYDSITALQNFSDVNFPNNYIPEIVLQGLNGTLWQQWTDWLPQFKAIIQLIIHPSKNPLTALNLPQYSPSVNDEISAQTQKLLHLLEDVQSASESLAKSTCFPFPIKDKTEWENFVQIIAVFQRLPNIPLQLLSYLSNKENYSVYQEWSEAFNQYQTVLNNILNNFHRNILQADVSTIEMEWKKAQQSWFLPKWLQSKKIKKQLSAFKKSSFLDNSELEQLFSNYNQLQEVKQVLQQSRFGLVQEVLNNLFKEEQTDLTDISTKAEMVREISDLSNCWGWNAFCKWVKVWQETGFQYSDEIKQKHSSIMVNFSQLITTLNEQNKNYEILTGIQFQQNENWNIEKSNQLQNIQSHLPHLKNWVNYLQIRNHGELLQLKWLINAYENKLCDDANIADYFNYLVHTSIVRRSISQHESLTLFNVALFESKIEQYKKIAKDFQSLTIKELRVKLAAQLPNITTEAMQSSEIGILQRAIKSRGRGLSIRKLFDQIPALLPRIAPCMLMSPERVNLV